MGAKSVITDLARSTGIYYPLHGMRPSMRAARRRRVDFYRQFIKRGDLAFDVGANIGNRVEAFVVLGARVIAIEPQPWCVDQLRSRYGSNRKVQILPIGAGAAAGSATLHLASAHTIASMSDRWMEATSASKRFASSAWNESVEVPVETLDALIAQHGVPHFCKIDVEGFELEVLKGLTHPVPGISFEFTPETSGDTAECLGLLQRLGDYSFTYSLNETMEFESGWTTAGEVMDRVRSLDLQQWGDVYARIG
jgi:FkbM family methyltransferase